MTTNATHECDLLVIGSGAGGLATAITAAKAGLKVLVVEKAPVFGGTTAFSGGVLWIPGNPQGRSNAPKDTQDAARQYLKNETGAFFDEASAELFLANAVPAVEWFERETAVKFVPTLYPDYHPTVKGGVDIGRSILAAPFDIRELGPDMARLRPPLKTITFIGMMFNSSNADLKHFFRATKSLQSFLYVAKRLAIHIKELLLYKRGVAVTSGNALAARLVKATFDAGVPIWTSSPAKGLLQEDGRVVGARIERDGQTQEVRSRLGVVLACGGFPHDAKRIKQAYPHLRSGGEHVSPTPVDNTGDGIALAESLGGRCEIRFPSASAWMPVSKVPQGDGSFGVFPHLLDRYKPGIIAVTRKGVRFCNESESYHDVGAAMIKACAGEKETAAWLVCVATALAKYGLGFVKPAPMPIGRFLKNGYLLKGDTLAALAQAAGIEAAALERTVVQYNEGAARGEDAQFQRGSTAFNRYLADPEHKPNPCVAPLTKGPFYAVKLYMGDLGTFDGLSTAPTGEVLDARNEPIAGLYAVGNDRASMMGGNYPAAGITLGPNLVFGWFTARHIVAQSQASITTTELQHAA